jgi:hypothetical protein
MTTGKTVLNRLITEDQTLNRPLISWPPHNVSQKSHTSSPGKNMPKRAFVSAKRKKTN